MKTLYPTPEPYAVHRWDVDERHCLYVEECGNRLGLPVIFLHGGPGSGCKVHHRCFFDSRRYRIILFDQRGCGRSTPEGELGRNTTLHLLSDLETIRSKLHISRWLLFGGSWGATLALLYAQKHADRVSGMILRGTFLARQRDLDWYIRDGVNRIYPEEWERLVAHIPDEERSDLIAAFYRRLQGNDELAQWRAARDWDRWAGCVALGNDFNPSESGDHVTANVLTQARIETHYAAHRYFIEEDRILAGCDRLPDVPILLVHGRLDLICPVESAYSLHQCLPQSELRILPHSGHIAGGDEMIDALVSSTDEMAARLAPCRHPSV
jgi:proline iminopeptidase